MANDALVASRGKEKNDSEHQRPYELDKDAPIWNYVEASVAESLRQKKAKTNIKMSRAKITPLRDGRVAILLDKIERDSFG